MRIAAFGLALALGTSAAGAAEIALQIKNCEAGRRNIEIRVFNGGDLVEIIPASSVESLSYGQTADLRCDDSGYRRCKLTVFIFGLDSVSKDYELTDSMRYQCFFGHKMGYYFDTRCHMCPP